MIKEIDERISRKLAGIRHAFRGVITLVKAAGAVQLLQADGLSGEKLQDNELFQHYGCTSNPPAGSMCVVVPVGGKTQHGIIIATEHGTYRLKNLKSGEVALYSDEGDSIVLKRGRIMEATTETFRLNASALVEFNTPKVQMNAPLVATTGRVEADLDIIDNQTTNDRSMASMREVYDIHTHHENDANGETEIPTQRMSGA